MNGVLSTAREHPLIQHLYVHIPFCTHICPYCAFHKERNLLPAMKAFLPAFRKELDWARRTFDIQPRTIFFGGGTPTALSLQQLEELFRDWPFTGTGEFTMEANPATITPRKAELLRAFGVDRISLGVQSFDPAVLKTLGRTHDAPQIRETVSILRGAGFSNISIDLIFGTPGQTLDSWTCDLEQALALDPQHISTYGLTYEEDTAFFELRARGKMQADESTESAMYLHTIATLETAGFAHYEISNFARPGFESRHNFACWEGRDYLGLGPGACSTIGLKRWENVRDTLLYASSLEQGGPCERTLEELSSTVKNSERLMLGLRTQKGVPESDIALFHKAAGQLESEGFLLRENGRARLTPRGRLVADSIAELFI